MCARQKLDVGLGGCETGELIKGKKKRPYLSGRTIKTAAIKPPFINSVGAEGGSRTHMPGGRTILSRVRLPVPPLRPADKPYVSTNSGSNQGIQSKDQKGIKKPR